VGSPFSFPSSQPSSQPTGQPSSQPTAQPTNIPSNQPSGQPSNQPSGQPTGKPSAGKTGPRQSLSLGMSTEESPKNNFPIAYEGAVIAVSVFIVVVIVALFLWRRFYHQKSHISKDNVVLTKLAVPTTTPNSANEGNEDALAFFHLSENIKDENPLSNPTLVPYDNARPSNLSNHISSRQVWRLSSDHDSSYRNRRSRNRGGHDLIVSDEFKLDGGGFLGP